MDLIQDLFRTHGPQYLARFGAAMPAAHQKVIAALMGCRTEANGCVLYQCEDCGESHHKVDVRVILQAAPPGVRATPKKPGVSAPMYWGSGASFLIAPAEAAKSAL